MNIDLTLAICFMKMHILKKSHNLFDRILHQNNFNGINKSVKLHPSANHALSFLNLNCV